MSACVCRRAVASECESLLLPFIDFATFRSRFPYTNTVTLSQVTETSATLHAGEQVSSPHNPCSAHHHNRTQKSYGSLT